MTTGKQLSLAAVRQHLLQSSEHLLAGNKDAGALGLALRSLFPELKRAFVVNCVPEQAEDIYWVLVSTTDVAEIEIPRGACMETNPPLLKVLALEAYRTKRLTRDVRQKLELAVELIESS